MSREDGRIVMPGSGLSRFHTPQSKPLGVSSNDTILHGRRQDTNFAGPHVTSLTLDTTLSQNVAPSTMLSPVGSTPHTTAIRDYGRSSAPSVIVPSTESKTYEAKSSTVTTKQVRPQSGHRVRISALPSSAFAPQPSAANFMPPKPVARYPNATTTLGSGEPNQQASGRFSATSALLVKSPSATVFASSDPLMRSGIPGSKLSTSLRSPSGPASGRSLGDVISPLPTTNPLSVSNARDSSTAALASQTGSFTPYGGSLFAAPPRAAATPVPEGPRILGFPYGHASNQGLRNTMEDEYIAISLQTVRSPLLSPTASLSPSSPSLISTPGDQTVSVFGIIDGHGGRAAAQFIRTHLFKCIKAELENPRPAPPPPPTPPPQVMPSNLGSDFVSPAFSSLPNNRNNPQQYNSGAPISVESCLRNAVLRLDEAYISFVVNDVYARTARKTLVATLESSGKARRIFDEVKSQIYMDVSPSMPFSALSSCDSGDEMPDTLAGAVLSVALIHHETKTVYVIHLGDTRCVIASRHQLRNDSYGAASALAPFMRGATSESKSASNTTKKDGYVTWQDTEGTNFVADQITNDHKATNPSEIARVRHAGGRIVMGRVDASLAVTRAIGDLTFKKITVSDVDLQKLRDPSQRGFRLPFVYLIHTPVTADPDIHKIGLHTDDAFLILACDGIWDVLTTQKAVDIITETLQDELRNRSRFGEGDLPLAPSPQILEVAAERLVQAALASSSTDNVSCLVVWLGGILERSKFTQMDTSEALGANSHRPSLSGTTTGATNVVASPGLSAPVRRPSETNYVLNNTGVGPMRRPSEGLSSNPTSVSTTASLALNPGSRGLPEPTMVYESNPQSLATSLTTTSTVAMGLSATTRRPPRTIHSASTTSSTSTIGSDHYRGPRYALHSAHSTPNATRSIPNHSSTQIPRRTSLTGSGTSQSAKAGAQVALTHHTGSRFHR